MLRGLGRFTIPPCIEDLDQACRTMNTTPSYRFKRAELRPQQRLLLVDGNDSRIGARAFDILLALVERRDRIGEKNELLEVVWPGVVVEENNLPVHISSLRKVLGPEAIATVPGRGYRFTAEIDDRMASSPAAAVASTDDELPPIASPLYGRAGDLEALQALVASHRLVSVVGAGGIGKTAMAKAVAERMRKAWPDGVCVVEFASVTDPKLVATTIASALQLSLGGNAQLEALSAQLKASRMLLVFDNCEHLLHWIAEVVDALFRAAPGVHLLATSQEPLHVAAEQVYRLGTLDLPEAGDVEAARAAGATALFEARARAVQPQFVLSVDNVAAVAEICRRLDGIPLAIELAAARLPLLGVHGLRARLDERFRILTGGARLALRRHQTLRAALDWAHGLLTDEEQTVFRRLGTFVGSFCLASAQRVARDAAIDDWAVLDHLGALVDKSLIVADTGESPRYRLLETTRAFALEMLRAAGESESALRDHAETVLAIFESSHVEGCSLTMGARIDRYLPDLDNARAALDWAAGPTGDEAIHVALAGAVAWLWLEVGLRTEGLQRTRAAMTLIGPTIPPRLEAVLVGSCSRLAFPIVGPEELAANARAVELYRDLADHQALFTALCQESGSLVDCGLIDRAEVGLVEAERLFQPGWPPTCRRTLLLARASVSAARGHYEASAATMEEVRRLATSLGDRSMEMTALVSLEQGAALMGRDEESVARGREMLDLIEQDRSSRGCYEHIVLSNLFMALTKLGALDEALEVVRRAMPMVKKVDRLCDLMDPSALYALKRGRPDDAARIVGRADSAFATSNMRRYFVEQQLHEKVMRLLAGSLQPDGLARLLSEGAALDDADAVHRALQD
jgi:predicted ATPase/DNA-binding winged helix-turn-helix (wHTH) protein